MEQLKKLTKHSDLLLGLGLLLVVSMLILPLPEFILDTGLVVTITTSIVILLISVNVKEPLHFSVFPSLLLITTLLRLSLSIAATKLILGSGNAGNVINRQSPPATGPVQPPTERSGLSAIPFS